MHSSHSRINKTRDMVFYVVVVGVVVVVVVV